MGRDMADAELASACTLRLAPKIERVIAVYGFPLNLHIAPVLEHGSRSFTIVRVL